MASTSNLTPATLPGPPLVLALDLGSAHCGAVLAPAELPLRPLGVTFPVDPADLGATVEAVLGSCSGVTRVILEHARFYVVEGASRQKIAAMAQAHNVCTRLHERLVMALEEHGIPVETIPRARWAHRVVPHTRGGITDLMARTGLEPHIADGFEAEIETWSQHVWDAAGCLVWALFPAPKRPPRARRYRDRRKAKRTPEEIAARRAIGRIKRRAYMLGYMRKRRGTSGRLASAECNCGPDGAPRVGGGRHKASCPKAPPPKGYTTESVNQAIAALDMLFGR